MAVGIFVGCKIILVTRRPDVVQRCVPIGHFPYRSNSSVATLLLLCLLLNNIYASYGADTISVTHSISGNQTLVSEGQNFELGFFKPGNSTNYYIGIWYKKVSIQTVLWVANRNKPISDINSAELKIIDGNLVILDESKTQIWSTNLNSTALNSTTAVLLDDGNLVLRGASNSVVTIWQSFDHPTDTFLPGSKLGYNNGTGLNRVLTSWKSLDDPAPGMFTLEVDKNASQSLIRWNRTETYWRSGSWNGQYFSLVPEMRLYYTSDYSYVSNENESYFTYTLVNSSTRSRLVMDVSGQIKQSTWLPATHEWNLVWIEPVDQCEVYRFCGAFGACNQNSSPLCNCLSGFEPRSPGDWNKSDFSGGCDRKTELQCGSTGRVDGKKPAFVASLALSWPQPSEQVPASTAGDCESICSLNCSCSAYAYGYNANTTMMDCWIWNGEVFNLGESLQANTTERISYLKLASSDQLNAKVDRKLAGIVSAIVAPVVVLFCCIGYVIYRTMKRQRERNGRLGNDSIGLKKCREDENKSIDVPFFELKVILAATNDFADANKLGEGGFGPVYKGELPGGTEIAVKRLSSLSGQGLEEFKNEVLLIAKLQHRNLVKIMGYCTKGDEKILLYEYMPNKSLDNIIFDRALCHLLDWPKRFDIIQGVTRGLLYLHQDSRLTVVHRDLKTSNILLDGEMNPKISDFGLARIVRGRETESNTTRVVGTYGYMSPEYALHGHFSIKSDVFSFGVVLLEIISGKKNTRFDEHQALSLLGHAWNLWKEGKPLDLMDQMLVESYDSNEVMKCIIIGLLCVQDDPDDRPTMSTVVSMLISDIGSLPLPKQPVFAARKRRSPTNKVATSETISVLTMSVQEGR